MKSIAQTRFVLTVIAGLCVSLAPAATIWTGPTFTYRQPTPYPNPPNDRDQLTANVALTRATPGGSGSGSGGLFNAVTESSFTKLVSPADTEWAVGSLSNYATLTYSDWTAAGGGTPVQTLPGQDLVVHLISDDIYLSLKFTSLPAGPGFTYIRSTPTPTDVPPTASIVSPTSGASFVAPANVPITASASDSDGSVTNVSFFDGVTFLGGTSNPPYSVTRPPAACSTGSSCRDGWPRARTLEKIHHFPFASKHFVGNLFEVSAS